MLFSHLRLLSPLLVGPRKCTLYMVKPPCGLSAQTTYNKYLLYLSFSRSRSRTTNIQHGACYLDVRSSAMLDPNFPAPASPFP